ncbi:MAG TPA: hypothetical protein DDZ39_08500 [Flavobacteriaceae bacterium]|jgi:hypothetical protein|nr:hypothetical protein [Flavobacteriaceae bacterium]HBS11942.1 hypothetical protein [Flavobacteriaceae bacterium]
MKTYFSRWTYQRLIQLGVGAYFIWNFIEADGKLSLAFGLLMSIQAVFNIGCFSTRGCSTSVADTDKPQPFTKDIKKINMK